jgi:hypothetical protein
MVTGSARLGPLSDCAVNRDVLQMYMSLLSLRMDLIYHGRETRSESLFKP